MMTIILLGYMGSGKSTVGKVLAKKLSLDFVDLDSYIEENENKTISKIFEDHGAIYFRKIEHEYLKELLKISKKKVISLGGGTPCYADNMTLINNHINATSIYLKATITTLAERLKHAKKSRPIIAELDDDVLVEYIAKHIFERQYYYNQANITLSVDTKTPIEISTKITTILNTL